MVATTIRKMLVPLSGINTGKRLVGNQDIILELNSDHTSLGRWCFQGAIVQEVMQEVKPIRIKTRG